MTNFTKTIVIYKPIELVTPETAQMTDFLKLFKMLMNNNLICSI